MITWLILSLNLIILFCFYLKYNKSSSIYKDSWRRKFTPFVKILDFICIMLYWKIFWHGFVAVKLFNFSHKAFYFEHIFVGKTSCNFDIIDVRINKIQLNIKKKFLCWQFDAICWLKKATKHWIISEIRYKVINKNRKRKWIEVFLDVALYYYSSDVIETCLFGPIKILCKNM